MIRFTSDNACEIVQSAWMRKSGSKFKTMWPTDYAGSEINAIVKNEQSLNNKAFAWHCFGCSILFECGKFVFLLTSTIS